MVALAILSLTLVVLLGIVTNNVRATNHAKLTTAATFLARAKMVDVEDEILYDGFSTDSESDNGTFKDQSYPQFRWESNIERIELPTDMAQKTKDQATDKTQEAKDPMSLMTGFLGGMMSSLHRADPDRPRGVGPPGHRAGDLGRGRAPRADGRGGPVPDRSGEARHGAHRRRAGAPARRRPARRRPGATPGQPGAGTARNPRSRDVPRPSSAPGQP